MMLAFLNAREFFCSQVKNYLDQTKRKSHVFYRPRRGGFVEMLNLNSDTGE
jgi:hypothetical protein